MSHLHAFDATRCTDHRLSRIAKLGLATAVMLFGLAIAMGGGGLDRDGTIGRVIFPVLGVMTLLAGTCAFFAGMLAMRWEHDRSMGTILSLVVGALFSGVMIAELFMDG